MAEIKNLKIDHVTITTPTDGYAGALAGYLTGGTVSNCHAYENVAINGTTGSIGGIAGRLANGIAEYCTSAATVSGNGAKNVFAGGIIGCAGVSATVRFCVNTGPVTSTRTEGEAKTLYTGGIVGLTGAGSEPASIINCYNIGSITGIAATGGITGRIHVDGAVVENCYNLGSISGEDNYSGGIVGWINKTATFANCFAKEQGSLPLFGNNDASVDVTGLVAKTESEIKALTDAIDAAIDELNKTPAEETTATTTASSTTSSDSSTSPTTFDQAYILILLASISIIVCFMFKKSSKKAV